MTPEPDLNKALGRAIRKRRQLMGLTQAEVAEAVGVKFQQIQKYECAACRMSAARLFQIARALRVPVGGLYPADPDTP